VKTRTIALTLAMLFAGVAVCLAADVNLGSWKLNEAKSKFAPGATKNNMVVYSAAGDSVKVTVDGVTGDGKAVHSEWTGKYDGKDYPLTGDPTGDTRSYKKINDRTLELTTKKGGKVTATIRIVVAADGMSRTVTMTSMDAMGKKTTSTAVYDKQ
jgi:hypothetical protein